MLYVCCPRVHNHRGGVTPVALLDDDEDQLRHVGLVDAAACIENVRDLDRTRLRKHVVRHAVTVEDEAARSDAVVSIVETDQGFADGVLELVELLVAPHLLLSHLCGARVEI